MLVLFSLSLVALIVATSISISYFSSLNQTSNNHVETSITLASKPTPIPTPTPTPTPVFNPNLNAVLPTHRIVAFYAVPGPTQQGLPIS
ncbi:hypothetical protein KDK_61020 [Dictyobacter kobayashii]|uniref:Uncharacterized protein n=1 Tax=Dictyobacter kobayashii TaxID=2014872 RepID=A0A402AT85_9CHLR|nr:hypothetical protein KDK_61020 [Dictyobacter kobayashii]